MSTPPGELRLPAPAGRLAENLVYFARALRRAGLPVGPGAVIDALGAVQAAGLATREDFYWTLHAVLVRRHEHSLVFDQAFRIFFQRRGYLEQLMALMSPVAPGAPAAAAKPAAARVQEALFADAKDRLTREQSESEIAARLTASDEEVLRNKDFAQMSAAEIAAAKEAIKRLTLSLHKVRTRRLVPDPRGHRIDMRRTLRASLQGGGALIDLKRRGPARRMPPMVALLDISGSMGEYTRLFLHFLHAVTDARKRVHSFLFGTRLTNVTRALKTKDPDEALAACSASVADWEGGTRIATSLAAFNRLWGRRVLGQGAVVLLITDGLERDADDRLAFEIDRLHRSCRRLVWLNPLLRYSAFEPKAQGIRTMLPHVDEFRAIHNLSSMAELIEVLSESDRGRGSFPPGLRRVA
ncbi:MAG: VWA domain-containing protein [Xanthobacteraceae bacterium]